MLAARFAANAQDKAWGWLQILATDGLELVHRCLTEMVALDLVFRTKVPAIWLQLSVRCQMVTSLRPIEP